MKMVEAMNDTLQRAQMLGMDNISSDNPELDYAHLANMYQRVLAGDCDHSEGKLGRWLGWIQAAVVAAGIGLTLDDMKEINRFWSEK